MYRDFAVNKFQHNGRIWYDVKLVVRQEEVNEFTGVPDVEHYPILSSSSPEEFDRFIDKCLEARE